jgi:hypothetical protein
MGAIVIAAVSGSGALTALVNTIGSYLDRDHRTEVEIQTPDGRKVRISSQAFKPAELEETLRPLLDMTKVAFLVGNDTFPEDPSIPPLRFTQNDACELGEILADEEICCFENKALLESNLTRSPCRSRADYRGAGVR